MVEFLVTGIVFGSMIWFWSKAVEINQLRARYSLYAVRDELIYLVAKGVLHEGDQVFAYYYKRVNHLLGSKQVVGLEHILDFAFTARKGDDFVKAIHREHALAKKMQETAALHNDEVRNAVEQYYRALGHLILAHSSLTRVAWAVVKQLPLVFVRKFVDAVFSRFDSQKVGRAYQAVKFVECEAETFAKMNASPA